MTESEWLTSSDLQKMLEHLRGNTSDRKLRLFACACCRQVWHLLTDERSQRAVEVAERFADGMATKEELAAAWAASSVASSGAAARWAASSAAWALAWTATSSVVRDTAWTVAQDAARAKQAALLRDIFGNPWQPVTIRNGELTLAVRWGQLHEHYPGAAPRVSPWLTWHDGLIPQMARQMYDSRDFSMMPVLADALEEVGCTNEGILRHCRQPAEHVRGCWIVDLILGKE
jgi:hypothetical protein